MFDYAQEALAYRITAENAEMRESLLKQELLANSIMMENLRVVTPEMIQAGQVAEIEWRESDSEESGLAVIYKAMLEAK